MAFDPLGRPAAETPLRDPIIRPFSDFGRVFSADDTDTIQRALDWSSESGLAVGQPGDFYVNGIVIPDRAQLIGPGAKTCNNIARAASSEPELVAIETDVLQNLTVKGVTFRGNGVAGQRGFRWRAIPG